MISYDAGVKCNFLVQNCNDRIKLLLWGLAQKMMNLIKIFSRNTVSCIVYINKDMARWKLFNTMIESCNYDQTSRYESVV